MMAVDFFIWQFPLLYLHSVFQNHEIIQSAALTHFDQVFPYQ